MPYVTERYRLPEETIQSLEMQTPNFGFDGLGEIVYLRTYSRLKPDGTQEVWRDTVQRVVEGNISIYKDYCKKNKLPFDEEYWNTTAQRMAQYIFDMKFLPPGRGLWALGSEYVYNRGSAALNNCGYTEVTQLSRDAAWLMDMLMCGVGVGFSTHTLNDAQFFQPSKTRNTRFTIPDTREGWVESVRKLIESYESRDRPTQFFNYDRIRKEGEPIKGFGGTASGPAPLMKLHDRLREYLSARAAQVPMYTNTRVVTDVMNAIGACVVAGNVRRSAELATGLLTDEIFLDLKNYERFPDRQELGWMSNNSVLLQQPEDFLLLPEIANRLVERWPDGEVKYFDAVGNAVKLDFDGNLTADRLTKSQGKPKVTGDPGIINLMSTQKYGRFKEKIYGPDNAVGFNPCAEQPLADKELCCLVEVFPTRCENEFEIYEAMRLATLFASIVSLLPTHSKETNNVIETNHRIGVSVSGIADWLDGSSIAHLTSILRYGYEEVVRPVNKKFMEHLGLKPSIRVTTVKPSGTISQLAGVSPGMHWPTFRYAIRRVRMSIHSPLIPLLDDAGYPIELDTYSDNTVVVEFPIDQGKTRSAKEVSMWEQASMNAFLQREWSDNGVSCTIYFDPDHELHDLEHLISMYAPQVKAMSLLGHTDEGAYAQMPYEGITRTEYERRRKSLKPVDIKAFVAAGSSDGMDSRFCANDTCEIPLVAAD
jgi:ribonucleoside-triphosphate reductase